MTTENKGDKKDQFQKGGIFTDTAWSDDTSARKLFSLERNNNYVRMGVRRWDNTTGKFNLKMSAGISINWNDRMKVLRQLLNMKKAVYHIVNASVDRPNLEKVNGTEKMNKEMDELAGLIEGMYTVEADRMYYECPLITSKGEILFQVKSDKECNPIAGITIKTEEATEFYVFDGKNTFVEGDIKINEVPDITNMSGVYDRIEDLYKSAKAYFYDFGVRDSFLSKMLGDRDGVKKYKDADEDSPF